MQVNIQSIKRKLLIKYPTFGSIMANLEFQLEHKISTAGTYGKKVLYNSKFVESLTTEEQVFLFVLNISIGKKEKIKKYGIRRQMP